MQYKQNGHMLKEKIQNWYVKAYHSTSSLFHPSAIFFLRLVVLNSGLNFYVQILAIPELHKGPPSKPLGRAFQNIILVC
jgi:hypothetical protein